MSRHANAAAIIMKAWKAVWADGSQADMQVEIRNQPFERVPGKVWGRLSLLPGDTSSVAVGGTLKRTPFALVLQVFIPDGKGTRAAQRAADAMSGLDNQSFKSTDGLVVVNFYDAGLSSVGQQDGHDAFNVTITGYYDTARTA